MEKIYHAENKKYLFLNSGLSIHITRINKKIISLFQ